MLDESVEEVVRGGGGGTCRILRNGFLSLHGV